MEIEIKFRLLDKLQYQKLIQFLGGKPIQKHFQNNFYLTDNLDLLKKNKGALRFRFWDEKCLITLKAGHTIKDGIGTCEEIEDFVDLKEANNFMNNLRNSKEFQKIPKLFDNLKVFQRIQKDFPEITGWKLLGNFSNVRKVFNWKNNLHIEVDKTKYDFGIGYELELEIQGGKNEERDKIKEDLINDLKRNEILFQPTKSTKLANFINKKID
ncbi:triphosphate tunnel metalloenzyme 3 [Anaeramoeba ignava]|uniref:Triphosphate tunnel metalloenzyme 3 n=1 Tax=Anaeramoeba ignava TaxID=1746090 RepID=A0A9Q0LLQ6_ANAIG|nr:triphosphate tunnel metalloenzyme 3 [Anaeramoeba ignava]